HRSAPIPTPCATPSPRICSTVVRICGRSRNCSATKISPPHRSTHMSAASGSVRSTTRPIHAPECSGSDSAMNGRIRTPLLGLIIVTMLAMVAQSRPVEGVVASTTRAERYDHPVDAPIIDRFRPPEHDWLPGNRGLKYGTEPGQFVTAIGPGTVTFSGQVGGDLNVTIGHPDGDRKSVV